MDNKRRMRMIGALTGAVNGLFGSGGGTAAVPLMKKSGASVREAHACSLALTLPLSAVSAIIYSFQNDIAFTKAAELVPFGFLGALCGAFFMKRISPVCLSAVFAVILIAAGVRMLII